MMRKTTMLLLTAAVALPHDGRAQTLGTLSWQLQPFCNRVTVTVNQAANCTLDGFEDQRRTAQRAPLMGSASPIPMARSSAASGDLSIRHDGRRPGRREGARSPETDPYGSANATMLLPEGAPFLPPPQAITTYCLPSIM